MDALWWIVAASIAMSSIAWIGLALVSLGGHLGPLLLPLVAFAAGSLLGGAFLHLLPEASANAGGSADVFLPTLVGFGLFLLMELFLDWHRSHADTASAKAPVSYLILIADGLHNFVGGLAIAASFLVSVQVGVVTWLAAAAHEVPQELGDFAILVRGGWSRSQALLANFLSASTVLPGALLAYLWRAELDVAPLLAFAAGNFIYVAASDLIPEVKHEEHL
ncbi:MAG: ZIP family metal transporter, partial [Vicinamibacterales bacterium]